MWAKDDEIRTLYRPFLLLKDESSISSMAKEVKTLLDQLEAMALKENGILLPLLRKNLSQEEFDSIAYEMVERSHPLLGRTLNVEDFGLKRKEEHDEYKDGKVYLPSGSFSFEELASILNALDEELTFIDKDGKFRYFNKPKDIVFARSVAELNEDVEDCHPAKALPAVRGSPISAFERSQRKRGFRFDEEREVGSQPLCRSPRSARGLSWLSENYQSSLKLS